MQYQLWLQQMLLIKNTIKHPLDRKKTRRAQKHQRGMVNDWLRRARDY